MKSINNYLNESSIINDLLFESVLELDENITLQNVYESLFDKLYSDNMINEGLFSRIGAALKKLGDKASIKGEEIDKKINSLSDAAKGAIETAKKKAGEAWDDVKGVYTTAVSAIDNAISASKETITNLAKQFKIQAKDIETTIGAVLTNVISKGGTLADEAKNWIKTPVQMTAFCSLITAAKICKVAGFDSSLIIDVLAAAGIN